MIGRNARALWMRRLLQALIVLLLLPTLVVSADEEGAIQLGKTELASRGYPNELPLNEPTYGLGKGGNSVYTSLSWFEDVTKQAKLAFASAANNLVKDSLGNVIPDTDTVCQSELSSDQRGCYDIFIQDPRNLERSNINSPVFITGFDTDVEGDALFPTLSRDGRYLVFQSGAEYTDYDDASALETDIFLAILRNDHDPLNKPALFRVSAGQTTGGEPFPGADANFHSGNVDCNPVVYGVNHDTPPVCRTHPSTGTVKPNFAHPHPVADATLITGEGVYVVFESMADLGENSNGYVKDIFIRQATDEAEDPSQQFEHTLLSRGCNDQPANGDSYHPVFVPGTDGRYIVFVSRATNLDCDIDPSDYPADNPGGLFYQRRANIFLLKRGMDGKPEKITLLTKGTDGKPANRYAEYPAVAFDGGKLYIAFQSAATNLTGESISNTQIFLYKANFNDSDGSITDPSFQLISIRPDNSLPQGPSYNPSISGDGRIVSFTSYDDGLVEGDSNNSCLVQNLEGWSS
ncbi:MAG: hypothetical protein ACK4SN_15060, partial [Bellilinea sp.]